MVELTLWFPGGWLKFFRWGVGVRLPDINLVFWLGPVR